MMLLEEALDVVGKYASAQENGDITTLEACYAVANEFGLDIKEGNEFIYEDCSGKHCIPPKQYQIQKDASEEEKVKQLSKILHDWIFAYRYEQKAKKGKVAQ